ncbi:hypothetical protein [Limnothrix sp. PR1529]|nr:hypothetical protein [Limnothrix sp. PR1529]
MASAMGRCPRSFPLRWPPPSLGRWPPTEGQTCPDRLLPFAFAVLRDAPP